MYRFVDNIEPAAHDAFVLGSPQNNLLQSAGWARVKTGWDHAFVGVFDGDEQVAGALVLIKRLPLSFTMMYVPRGPVMDYGNRELVLFFFRALKDWAKKQRCLFVKVDPNLVYARHHEEEEKEVSKEVSRAIDHLAAAGLRHLGFTTGMSATIQPRFQMQCLGAEYGEEHFTGKGKKNYRIAVKNGHFTTIRAGKEKMDDFARVMGCTIERKGVALRDREYYELLLDTYGEDAYLTLTYLDLKSMYDEVFSRYRQCVSDLNQCPESAPKKRAKLEETLESLTRREKNYGEYLVKYGDSVCVAGTLTVMYGDTGELLYAGADNDFRRLQAPYLTWDAAMRETFAEGRAWANMGGISGLEGDGLETFKRSFHPYIFEYAGEFDLPVMKPLYGLAKKLYESRK